MDLWIVCLAIGCGLAAMLAGFATLPDGINRLPLTVALVGGGALVTLAGIVYLIVRAFVVP